MEVKLSNVEIVLLEIIAEKNEISGYEIKKIIDERGYKNWANVGKTSIYIGIKKLLDKKLIESKIIEKKVGKGPLPTNIKITQLGFLKLKKEISNAMLSFKDNILYYIGLAGISYLSKEKLIEVLENRKNMIVSNIENINRIYEQKGGKYLPLQAKILFEHPIIQMEADLKFIDKLIEDIKNGKND